MLAVKLTQCCRMIGLFFLTAWVVGLSAQELMEPIARLSPEQQQKLRAVLEEPVDPNSLYATQIEVHKRKEQAAILLGDFRVREKNLIEWAKIDADGKWGLRSFWSGIGKREEAYALGQEILSQVKFPHAAVRIRVFMAGDYIQDNNLSRAGELLDQAEQLVRYELPNVPRRGELVHWIARAETEFLTAKSFYLMRKGKWDESIATSKLAVEKSKDLLRVVNIANSELYRTYAKRTAVQAAGNLVNQQVQMGQFASAEWSLREALQVAKANGFNDNHMANFYLMIADLSNGSGHYAQALPYLQRTETLILAQGIPKQSNLWLGLKARELTSWMGMDQWDKALALLNSMEVDTQGGQVKIENVVDPKLRAFIYLKSGDSARALDVLSSALNAQVTVHGEKHYTTALTRGLLGVARLKSQQLPEARQAFTLSREHLTAPDSLTGDFVENAFQIKTKRFVFESFMQLLAQTAANNTLDAQAIFQLADEIQSSSVQQALSEAAVRSGVNAPGVSEVIRKEQDAKNESAALTAYISGQGVQADKARHPQVVEQMRLRLFEIEKQRKEYKAQIQKNYPEYFQLLQPKAPSHQDIAQSLAADEVFVAILPMEDETYVWAINHQGEIQFSRSNLTQKKASDLVERVRKTLDVAAMGPRAPAFDALSAHQLYQATLLPIAPMLEGKKHLVVATSGALANLPMAVLVKQAPVAVNAAFLTPAWLIHDIAISQVPTAGGWMSLKRFAKVPSSAQPLMAWGDPLFDVKASGKGTAIAQNTAGAVRSLVSTRTMTPSSYEQDAQSQLLYSQVPPLPETRDEVLALARILSANPQEDLILGAQATRQSVLKQSASGALAKKQVVVFATHGLMPGDLPNLNQPALAMAGTDNPSESPLLTLEDVLTLKLNADWVVLSACNTAGSDGKAEEALSGLARGFFFAGSRSLLVTHWSVESESAMLLTTHTFDAYKKNPGMRRAEALRQAMLETMKTAKYTHPTFWAPYVLVGEGGR